MAVPAITRAAAVLRLLADSDGPLPLSALASRLGLAKSSLHNLCSTLVEEGLLEKDGANRYSLGLYLVELARQRLAGMDLVSQFLKICHELDLNETIVLSVLRGPDVVYVACVNADRPLAVRYQIGMRLPAGLTASGKAILATYADAEVRSLVGARIENLVHPGTDKSVSTLLAELHEIRDRGYSVDDEETAAGMICYGAPIFDGRTGACCGAVAISCVKSAMFPVGAHVSDDIVRLANDISKSLGASAELRETRSL